MATGIKDKFAILGMGCSKFGERWDMNAEDLIVEAVEECLDDAGVERSQIDAAWFSTAIEEVHVGKSGVPLSVALRLPYIPVTRVENYCASGTESFRGAVESLLVGSHIVLEMHLAGRRRGPFCDPVDLLVLEVAE